MKINEKKCMWCEKPVLIEEKKNNFYIKLMNQATDNLHQGKEPVIIYWCSWECIEAFIEMDKDK